MVRAAGTKEEIFQELKYLRKRVAELEALETEQHETKKQLLDFADEYKYRTFFKSANDIIIILDNKGKVIDVNDKLTEVLGYKKEKLAGKNLKSLTGILSKKSLDTVSTNLKKRLAGENVPPYEIEMVHKNGTLITLEINSSVMEKDGKIVGDLAILRDITERKRSENEIKQNSADIKLINTINNAANQGCSLSEIITLVAEETRTLFGGNAATIYLLSEDRQYLVMQNYTLPPRMISIVERIIGERIPGLNIKLKTNGIYTEILDSGEARLTNDPLAIQRMASEYTDKKVFQRLVPRIIRSLGINSVISVPLVSGGNVIGILDISNKKPFTQSDLNRLETITNQLVNVINRKLTEHAFEEVEERLHSMNEASPEGFALHDGERIIDVNEGGALMFGYERSEVIGKKVIDFIAPESVDIALKNIAAGYTEPYEVDFNKKGGSIFAGEIRAKHVVYKGKKVRLVSFRDLTAQKQYENLLETIVDHAPVSMYIEQDNKFKFVNNHFCQDRGYTKEELLTMDAMYGVHPDDRTLVRNNTIQMLKGERKEPYQFRTIDKNGDVRWVLQSVSSIVYSGKRASLATYLDFTEQRKAEQALAESHSRFVELADLLPLSVYEIDNKGEFTYYNKEAQRCWNMAPETAPKESMLEAFVPEDKERLVQNTARVLMGEDVGAVEYTALRQDGNTFPVLIYGAPIVRQNEVVGIRGVSIDITERKQAEEALRASETKYRFLSENMADIAFTIDMNMMTTYVSPSIERILGFTPEERLRQLPQEQLTPRSFKLATETLYRELHKEEESRTENNDLFVLELEYYHKDGSVRIMETTLRAVRDDQRKPVAIYGLCHDITERKNAENELRIREQKLRSIFSTAPIGIGMITNRSLVEFNDYMCEISGYTREELFEKSIRMLYPSDDEYEAARKQIYEEITQKGIGSIETRWRQKSGELIDVLVKAVPLSLPTLQEGITFTVMNVTERKKAEEALKESEERYRLIVDNSRDVIFTMNINGEITYISPVIIEMLGYSQEEFIGKYMAPLIHPDDIDRVTELVSRSITEGYHTTGTEYRIRHASGEWRWHSCKGKTIRDNNGNFLHFLGVATDITERKKAEEALKNSEERFRRLAENARDVIFRFHQSPSIGFDYISPAVQRILGYTPEEIYADSLLIFKVVHPDSRAFLVKITSRPQNYLDKPAIIQWIHKNGEIIWTEQRSVPIYDGDKLVAIEGIVRDITERRKSDEALRISEEKFRNSMDSSPVGIRIVGEDGNTVYANQAMLDVYGYESLTELNETRARDRYTPESYAEHVLRVQKRQSGEPVSPNYEVSVVHKDGNIRHLQVFRKEVLWEGKKQYQVLYNDITEQKRAQEALKNSEERFRRLAENARDLIFRCRVGDNRGFEYVSRSSTRITGYTPEEFYADPDLLFRLVHPEDRQLIESVWNNLQDYRDKAIISRWIRKDGKINWIEQRSSYIVDDRGEVVAVQGIARDVTEREEAALALKESEANYRNSIASSPMGIMVFKREGEIIYANQALLDLYGFSSLEELQKTPVKERYTPESFAEYMVRHEDFMDGKTGPMDYEISIVRKDRTIRQLQAYRREIVWGGEKQYQLLYLDITERKKAENAMRESGVRFKELARLLPQSIWETDEKGMITYTNEKTMEVYGYSRQDVVPMSYLQNLIPQDRERAAQNTQRILEGEILGGIPYTALRKDSSVFPVLVYASSIVKNGRRVGLRGITIDTTEQKMAEKRMEQAAQEWRTTFDSLTDMVCIIGSDFKINRVNRAYANMLNKEPQELLGKVCYELIHNADCPHVDCPHRKTMRTGKPAAAEFYEPHLKTYIEVSTSPVFDENGNIKGSVHVIRDISERKHMEQQLMLTDRLASVGELASGVAHELNNPLTSVIGFSQLLMEGEVPENIKEDLNLINSEAQRAASIVKNLLTFARKHAAVKQATRMNSLVDDVLKLRAYEHKVNNIEVVKNFATDIPEIMVDYFQIQQVFLNLIINAEFFMGETHHGGVLTISTEKVRDRVKISFADDGPGIPAENLSRIFDPFFTTKEVGKGTGLGLSICHGIVTEHGGRIYAESEIGKGTTFIIELPLYSQTDKAGE